MLICVFVVRMQQNQIDFLATRSNIMRYHIQQVLLHSLNVVPICKTDGIFPHAWIQRGGRGPDHHPPPPSPEELQKYIGFLSNTGPDTLKNHKAIKPAFNVGPSFANQRNAIEMAFR